MSVYQPTIHPPSRLAPALEGKLVLPTHSGFDQARQAWNLAVQQHPAAVAYPETAFDVAATVLFAAERGQRVAPQGTGHNAAPFGSLDNTILLKTERMRGVTIDPVARTAHVRAGTLWIEVVEAAARYGLAALAGSSPDVGVVGYTLGGGMSFLARKYGLAANNVRSIELVTADGRLVRADHEHEPELFWALRGGGGNFGIVTSIELELFELSEVYAGILWYPIERGDEVLHAWRELTRSDADDDRTLPADPADPGGSGAAPGQVFRARRGDPRGRARRGRRAAGAAALAGTSQRHDRHDPGDGAQPPAHGSRAAGARRR